MSDVILNYYKNKPKPSPEPKAPEKPVKERFTSYMKLHNLHANDVLDNYSSETAQQELAVEGLDPTYESRLEIELKKAGIN